MLVSVADSSVRVLRTHSCPSRMTFSPDGQWIVYDFAPEEESPERDIYLLPSDGSGGMPLVEHPTNDFVLGWAPDGQPRGVPERVKPDIAPIAVHWLGLTGDDSYYYGHFAWVNDVYVVTLDPATGTLQPPQKLVSHVGLDTSPEWSPDGRYLLAQGRSPKLRGAGVQGFYRIDAYTGEITPIVSRSLGLPSNNPEVIQGGMEWPVWSSDGKAIFYRRSHKSNRSQSLVVRDLETGRERELYRAALPAALGEYVGASNLAVSPNGQRLAFVWSDFDEEGPTSTALKVITTARGGEPRELLRVQPPEVIFQPAWMPDGGHVVFGRGRAVRGQLQEAVDRSRDSNCGGFPRKVENSNPLGWRWKDCCCTG